MMKSAGQSASRRNFGRVRQQSGMTLIEVMISVLILVIGMLGLAAMQLQSVKFNESAKWRSQATFLAYDIVERIRANKDDVAQYGIGAGASAPGGTDVLSVDKREWLEQLAQINGEKLSTVTLSNSNKTVTVKIVISDLTRTANDTDTTFTYTTLLD